MLVNMNQSERLHNQGNEEQNITRELELSMQLRTTCEEILQEKGKTIIDSEELALHYWTIFGMPLGMIKSIRTKINPLDLVRHRSIKLKYSNDPTTTIQIDCSGINPSKAKFIDVKYFSDSDGGWLRLYKDRTANFMGYKPDTGSFGTGIQVIPIEVRPAFPAELVYYNHQINQSSPIEHK